MKKVGKEFRKSLSAILAAAMVVSSMPETSLVANAEEVDAQVQEQSMYNVDEVGATVDKPDSHSTVTVDFGDDLGEKFDIDEYSNLVKSDDKYYAVNANEAVVVNISPKAGYRLLGVSSSDAEVTPLDEDGCYQIDEFYGNVTITVTTEKIVDVSFTENNSKAGFKITTDSNIEYNSTTNKYTVVDNSKPAKFKITAAAGSDVISNVQLGSETISPDNNGYYTIPAGQSANVAITFDLITQKLVTFTGATVDYVIEGLEAAADGKYRLTDEDISFALVVPANKTLKAVKYKLDGAAAIGTGVDVENSRNGICSIKEQTLLTIGKAIEIIPEFEDLYTVKFTKDKDVTVTSATPTAEADGVTYKVMKSGNFTFTLSTIPAGSDYTYKVTVGNYEITASDGTYTVTADKLTASTTIKVEKVYAEHSITAAGGNQIAYDVYVNGVKKTESVKAKKGDKVEIAVKTPVAGKVYTVTATDSGSNKLEVTHNNGKATFVMGAKDVEISIVEAVEGAKITIAKDDNVKLIQYSTDESDWTVAGSSIVVPKDTAKVYFKVTAKDHYQSTGKFYIGDDENGTAANINGNFELTITENKPASVRFATENITHTYVIDSAILTSKDDKAYVRISPSKVTQYSIDGATYVDAINEIKVGKDGDPKVWIKVNEEDTFEFDVEVYDQVAYKPSVSVDSALTPVEGEYAYSYKAVSSDTANKAITVDLTANSKVTVIFAGKTTADDSAIKEYDAYVANDKITTEGTKVANPATGVTLYAKQNFRFDVKTNDGYTVKSIEWFDASTGASLGKVEGVNTAIIENISKSVNVKVETAIDPAYANTVVFDAGDSDIAITTAGATLGDDNKCSVIDTEEVSFNVTAKPGYKITAVTIDGVAEKDATLGSYTVKFDKDKDNQLIKGQLKSVVITTEPVDNDGAKLISTDISVSGCGKNEYSVNIAGATKYDDYYVIDKDTNEVTVTVALKYGYKLNTNGYTLTKNDGTTQITNGLIPINELDDSGYLVGEENGSEVVYTFKIPTKLLSTKTAGVVAADKLSFVATDDMVDVSIDNGVITSPLKAYTDARYTNKISRTTDNVRKGDTIYLLLDEGNDNISVYQVDADGKEIPIAVDTLNPAIIRVTEDMEIITKDENLDENYRVNVTLSSGADVDIPANGIANAVTVEGGEKVTITASKAVAPTTLVLESFADPAKDMASRVDQTSLSSGIVTVYTDAKDAGKTITFDLVTKETTEDGKEKKVVITPFTITISERASEVTIDGIEKDSTVEIEAGTVKKFPIKYNKATLDSLKAFAPANMIYFDVDEETGETDYNTIVIDATDAKASDTASKASVKVDGKSLLDFNIKVVSPKLGIKNATVVSQGTTYVNVSLTPETITRSDELNNNFMYEVTVTPAATSELNKTAPANLSNKTYTIPVETSAGEDTITTVASSAKLALNNAAATALDKAAWDYTVSIKMVLLGEDGKTVLASSDAVTFETSTKNAYYEDNLQLKKKQTTVYSGQTAAVATIKYSDNASYVDPTQVSVNVINADGATLTWPYEIGSNGDVLLTIPAGELGKYKVEVGSEVTGTNLNASKASVSINVKAGADRLDLTNVPNKITKNSAKNVTMTLKPVATSTAMKNGAYVKAASQKLTYTINSTSNPANKAYVSMKGSKITISKDFVMSTNTNNNKVYVDVYAAGYTNYDGSAIYVDTLEIEVTSELMELKEIKLVNASNETIDLSKAIEYSKVRNGLNVVVVDKDGKTVTNNVKITPASGDAYVSNGKLWIKTGKNPKSVTIKATTLDGSKKKTISKKINFTYNTEATLTAVLDGGINMTSVAANTWQYEGNGGLVTLYVKNGEAPASRADYNYTVAVKGGKILNASEKTSMFDIQPTAKDMTITITNKAVKPNVKTVIKATDLRFANEKAPKIKAVKGQKLFMNVECDQELDYLVATDYNAVMVSQLTYTAVKADRKQGVRYQDYGYVEIKDGKFTLPFDGGEKNSSVKLSVVFGNVVNGRFVPATKAANLTVKNTKVAEFKPYTNYTVNYNDNTSVAFAGTPDVIPVTVKSVKDANINGKPNNFTQIFTCTGTDEYISMVGLASLKNYMKDNKIDSIDKIPEQDLKGYVEYTYWNGKAYVEKTVAVTMTLSDKTADYQLVQCEPYVNVYGKVEVKTHIYLGDDIVKVSSVKPVTSGWVIDKSVKDDDHGEYLSFRSSSAKVGANEVEFKFVPAGALDNKEITVKGTLNIEDPAAYTGKISVDETKAVVDFNKGTVDQLWLPSDKTGTYTKTVAAADAITYAAKGTKISSMKTTLEGVKVEYNTSDETITFTLTKNKITAGQSISVPIEVTFQGGAVAENITYTVQTPAVLKGMTDIVAEVRAEIENTESTKGAAATDQARLNTSITGILNKNKASGITLASVTCDYSTEGVYLAKVKLTDNALDKDKDYEFEANLLGDGVKRTETIENINDAVSILSAKADMIVDEGFVDAGIKAGRITEEDRSKYLEVSASTTTFEIRAFLQSALDAAVNGSDYMISLPIDQYKVVKPQPYTKGSISFKAYVNKKGDDNKVAFARKKLTTKQLVDETPATP